jgi:ankyrin repeat protein
MLTLCCRIRDVQMQLNTFFGDRPNMIRKRGVLLPKARLRLVRECRALQSSNKSHLAQWENGLMSTEIDLTVEQQRTRSDLDPVDPPTTEGPFSAQLSVSQLPELDHEDSDDWYEHGFLNTADFKELEALLYMGTAGFADFQGKDEDEYLKNPYLPEVTVVDPMPSACIGDFTPRSPIPLQESEARNGEHSPSLSNIPSLECGERSIRSANSLDIDHSVQTDPAANVIIASENDSHDAPNDGRPLNLAMGEDERSNSLSESLPPPSSKEVFKSRPKSIHSSIHSFKALGKRLPLKTESYLEDVWSVLQNLTISSGSAHDGSRISNRGSAALSGTQTYLGQRIRPLADIDENEASDSSQPFSEVRLPLPGDFAAYTMSTTYYIGLRRYRSKLEPQDRSDKLSKSNWRTKNDERFISSINKHSELLTDPPFKDLHRKDDFGNSVLHIAAALKKSGYALIGLIDNGVDVHTINSAGETFFHLLDESVVKETYFYHMLLEILRSKGFDFSQRDCLGQTPFHLLMQPWMDKSILEQTLVQLPFLNIALPLSRDSFGCTVAWQLVQAGVEEPEIKAAPFYSHKTPTVFLKPGEYTWSLAKFACVELDARSAGVKTQALQNYGAQTAIQTVADLLTYERHADLLRTILRACSSPQHEDAAGRNGLHCLAEVSFSLPLPESPLRDDSDVNATTKVGKRETYLQDLLKAGVDVNNYDKQGYTPLMAFINHNRDDEDDETTEKLLFRLYKAGANIHRRDRLGQSLLHMAVKLGKKAATNFLLNKGANVRARDTAGKGVVALAWEASKKVKTEDPDDPLYAQILLCIDLVSRAGGITAPTFLQEWTVAESKESRWPLVGGKKPRK